MWLLSRNVNFKRKGMIIGKKRMFALLADSPLKMTVGLMFREKFGKGECMLFSFPRDGQHPIWTRNMRFPIDIVWCDSSGRVVDFVLNAKPAVIWDFSGYNAEKPSRYVIEFNAGFVKENRIKKGKIILKIN